MRPVFDQLNIVSGDPSASIEFYRRLGVPIPEERVWRTTTGIHHVSAEKTAEKRAFALDIDSVAFARLWNCGWRGREALRGRVVIGFSVPSPDAVDDCYADLTGAGYTGLQPPCDAFWGSRYAVVEDPDGIAVGLMSPVRAEFRSPPPNV